MSTRLPSKTGSSYGGVRDADFDRQTSRMKCKILEFAKLKKLSKRASMRSFFILCLTFLLSTLFVISELPCYAQKIDETIVTYSKPVIVSGDPVRCRIAAVANGYQISIIFPSAAASSQQLKKDSLKCRIETNATFQIKKGWYLHSIEHTISGGIVQAIGSKAVLTIQSTFQKKNILRLLETKSDALISRSNKILADFAWSKAKQCSGKVTSGIGSIILNLNAQTQGDAQASLDGFDAVLNFAECDSQT